MATDPDVLAAMQKYCIANADPESAHSDADALLCQVLADDGHDDLVALWRQVRKWYS